MMHVKNYLPLQVFLIFAFDFLSAENRFTTQKGDAIIPRVVSGPGEIVDISKASVMRNDESKDVNDLLYEVYRKFQKDPKRHAPGREKIQNKKGMIVETEAITYPQWKAVDDLTKAEVVKKAVKPNAEQMLVKKEIHHIAQKELERTIDKLIESLTRVSNDGKFEESDINKSIEDMSKFADKTDINIPADNDAQHGKKDNGEIENFRDFKERFYKTFMDVGKRQQIVYHGKDTNAAKQSLDSDNNIKASKLEGIRKELDFGKRNKIMIAHLSDKNIPADNDDQLAETDKEKIQGLGDFKERFYKTFREVDKRQNIVYHGKKDGVTPRMVYHGKDNAGKQNRGSSNFLTHDKQSERNVNNRNGEPMKDLADLYEELKKQTAEVTKDTNVQNSLLDGKHGGKEQERRMNIERVKKALVSLFDLVNDNAGAVSGGNRRDSLHRDNSGYVAGRRDFDIIEKNRHVTEDQYQKKRRLLSMMRSLDAQLSKQGNRGLLDPSNQNGNSVSNKIRDRFESELDSFASGIQSIRSNKKYENSALADAMKGFAFQSKSSEKKSA